MNRRGRASGRSKDGRSHRTRVARAESLPEGGFTLLELIIVLLVVPIVVGALSLGLITIFSLQNSVASRVNDAGDAEVAASTFLSDVQSSQMLTENPIVACGTGVTYPNPSVQVLGLEWGGLSGAYLETVSYVTEPNAGMTTFSLVRQVCTGGNTVTPALTTTLATDLTAAGASALPTITCSALALDSQCTSGAYATTWIPSLDVQNVLLDAQESSLLPAPNPRTEFALTLAAAPRVHVEPLSNTTAGGNGRSPIEVLGNGLCNTLFTITNGVTVSINVGTGSGNGTLELNDPQCGTNAVTVAAGGNGLNPGTLIARQILTSNPNLNSVVYTPCPGSGSCVYPIQEQYTQSVTDPLKDLQAPPTSQSNFTTTQTCSFKSGAWFCPSGYYATDPFSGGGSGQTINFVPSANCFQVSAAFLTQTGSACEFVFSQGLTIPGGATVNLGNGVYAFEPNASNVALSTGTNVTINGYLTGSSSELLYVARGSATFQPGITINLQGLPQYGNVAIWDAASTSALTIGNNSGGGGNGYAGYGGIYAPNVQVNVNNDNNTTLTVSFIVSASLYFKQNLTLEVTEPS